MYQDAFPRSIFFCSALAEWYIIPSSMPATVNTPPTMAHTPVRKCVKDRLCSVSWTIIGLRSYMKNTPVTSQRNGTVIKCKNESCILHAVLNPTPLNDTCWDVGVAIWKDWNGTWECTSYTYLGVRFHHELLLLLSCA